MKTPTPLYPCAFHDRGGRCRGDQLCYAHGLFRPLGSDKWVCEFCCYEHLNITAKDFGISLAEHLKQTVVVMPREMPDWLAAEFTKASYGRIRYAKAKAIWSKAIEHFEKLAEHGEEWRMGL